MPPIYELPPAPSVTPVCVLPVVNDPLDAPLTVKATVGDLIALAWPINGPLFITLSDQDPAALLGFGTWEQVGRGRVLVGQDTDDVDFDTVGETLGSKTHTISEAQLPAHAHPVNDPGHTHLTQRYPTANGSNSGFTADTSMNGAPADNTLPVKSATTEITVGNTGGGQPIPLVQPSLVVRFWRRTA